jgi:hypothetical protein
MEALFLKQPPQVHIMTAVVGMKFAFIIIHHRNYHISCHGSCTFWFDLHVQNGGNKSVGNGGKTRVGNGGKEWREEEETLKIMAGRKDPIIFTVHSAAAAATLAAGGPLPLALVSMHGAEALSLHDLTPRK